MACVIICFDEVRLPQISKIPLYFAAVECVFVVFICKSVFWFLLFELRYYRTFAFFNQLWAKSSHLQYTVYETGSQAGNLRSRPGEKHS